MGYGKTDRKMDVTIIKSNKINYDNDKKEKVVKFMNKSVFLDKLIWAIYPNIPGTLINIVWRKLDKSGTSIQNPKGRAPRACT